MPSALVAVCMGKKQVADVVRSAMSNCNQMLNGHIAIEAGPTEKAVIAIPQHQRGNSCGITPPPFDFHGCQRTSIGIQMVTRRQSLGIPSLSPASSIDDANTLTRAKAHDLVRVRRPQDFRTSGL